MNDAIVSDDQLVHKFEYYDINNKVPLNGKTHIITVELKKFNALVAEGLSPQEIWAMFFKYAARQDKRDLVNTIIKMEEGVNMAIHALKTISVDEQMRMIAISEEKRMNDYRMDINSATDFALQKGRAEGRAEGRTEERREIIANMRKQGFSEEQINMIFGKS